ncbi:hypothetical protein OXPF_00550 [Oxobacter pfennigii]|uniref:Zinc-ribbon domain-containing protein n=1 Tax=Oxobacter pfennigii TaxID=36849 RepID=A0A0P8Z2E3_9CLOT|nr:hypothetical protein [Oxobacter pfennigii]KPU46327.1 hypothetical protein OXPF_00550 [Oxobacter pfennigii]
MNCKKCGQKLDPHYTFCPNCGRSMTIAGKNKYSFENDETTYIQKINETKHPTPDFIKGPAKLRTIDNEPDKIKEKVKAYEETASGTEEEYYEEEKVKKGRGAKALIFGLLIAVILAGAGIFAAYFAYQRSMGSSSDEYISSISQLHQEVKEANDKVAAAIKADTETLLITDILKETPAARNALNTIAKSYDKISAPSVYAQSHASLGDAIRINKQVYDQLEAILKNPASADVQESMDQLSEYIDECMNNYATVETEDLSFTLPNEILSLSSRLQPWVAQKQAQYAQVSALIASFTEYFDSMAMLFSTYDTAAADFNQILISIRNNQEPWDALFEKIDASEGIINTVKENYIKQTVPTELKSINARFSPILDEMLDYYSKLRYAAVTEMNFNSVKPGDERDIDAGGTDMETNIYDEMGIPDPNGYQGPATRGSEPSQAVTQVRNEEDINRLYNDANMVYQSASQNYQQFALDLKAEKDKFLDPEYVLTLKSVKK